MKKQLTAGRQDEIIIGLFERTAESSLKTEQEYKTQTNVKIYVRNW